MQSALPKDRWVMQVEIKDHSQFKHEISGWVSSSDMSNEIKMTFDRKESAIRYALKNSFNYEIIDPVLQKFKKRSYAQNFIKKLTPIPFKIIS